jgi:hypothetical protein
MNPFEICPQCPHPTVEEFCTVHHLVQPKEEPWFNQDTLGKLMKLPKTGIGVFFMMFSVELSAFFVCVVSGRAVAQANYLWAAIGTTLLITQNFAIIKIMADDPRGRSWTAGFGCVAGAVLGTTLSIYITKHYLLGS